MFFEQREQTKTNVFGGKKWRYELEVEVLRIVEKHQSDGPSPWVDGDPRKDIVVIRAKLIDAPHWAWCLVGTAEVFKEARYSIKNRVFEFVNEIARQGAILRKEHEQYK